MFDSGVVVFSIDRIKRGFLHFAIGKVLSGILGVVWLFLIVRLLSPSEFGIYLSLLSVFEVTQLLSSFGLYSFAQRYLVKMGISLSRPDFLRGVCLLIFLRFVSLALAGAALNFSWRIISNWLEWDSNESFSDPFFVFLVFEGVVRYCDVLFEGLVRQGYSQSVSFFKNLARIAWASFFVTAGGAVVSDVLYLEALLSVFFVFLNFFVIFHLSKELSQSSAESDGFKNGELKKAVEYSFSSYVALAIGQTCSPDMFRLLIGHFFGSGVIAVYGLAQALSDVVRRYMPIQLLLGFVRSVVVARLEASGDHRAAYEDVALLHKLNTFFLLAIAGWAYCGGAEALALATGKEGFEQSSLFLVGFLILLGIQSQRILLALISTVREDGVSILMGTVFGVSGVIVGVVFTKWIGPWGAILGLIWVDVVQIVTLNIRLKLSSENIAGGYRFYFVCSMAAAFSALMVARINLELSGYVKVAVVSLTFFFIYLLITAILKPFSLRERNRVNKILPFPIFLW